MAYTISSSEEAEIYDQILNSLPSDRAIFSEDIEISKDIEIDVHSKVKFILKEMEKEEDIKITRTTTNSGNGRNFLVEIQPKGEVLRSRGGFVKLFDEQEKAKKTLADKEVWRTRLEWIKTGAAVLGAIAALYAQCDSAKINNKTEESLDAFDGRIENVESDIGALKDSIRYSVLQMSVATNRVN